MSDASDSTQTLLRANERICEETVRFLWRLTLETNSVAAGRNVLSATLLARLCEIEGAAGDTAAKGVMQRVWSTAEAMAARGAGRGEWLKFREEWKVSGS